jgi:hypothetical protein
MEGERSGPQPIAGRAARRSSRAGRRRVNVSQPACWHAAWGRVGLGDARGVGLGWRSRKAGESGLVASPASPASRPEPHDAPPRDRLALQLSSIARAIAVAAAQERLRGLACCELRPVAAPLGAGDDWWPTRVPLPDGSSLGKWMLPGRQANSSHAPLVGNLAPLPSCLLHRAAFAHCPLPDQTSAA